MAVNVDIRRRDLARRLRRIPVTFVTCAAMVILTAGAQPGGAAQSTDTITTCETTKTTYAVEICLTAPAPDVQVDSDVLISATVTVDDPKIIVRSVDFNMGERRALTDFDIPYQFMLPAAYWGSGTWELSATARLSDKEKSIPARTDITITTGAPMGFPQAPFTAPTGDQPAEGESLVVAAIGDSAGGSPQSAAVANLIGSWNPDLMLYLGDVYNSGTYPEFMNWYDPDEFVGRFRDITLPTIGNHEYSGADIPRGYMEYWGNPPHYYSVDTAGWHIVSLDTNPKFNETHPDSQQMQWLVKDLEASDAACTLAFFHHPPYSVGSYSEQAGEIRPVWRALVNHGVTLALSGHDHNYQRWERLDGDGQPDPNGTVSMVVGTGGQSEYQTTAGDDRVAGPVLQETGALRMELNPNGVSTQFITVDGIVRDTTVVPCDPDAADTTPPSAPPEISSFREQDGSVTLRWLPAVDDTGVTSYQVYRDGDLIGPAEIGFSLIDTQAKDLGTPAYHVIAVDAAGNGSPPSAVATADPVHGTEAIFADSFSSGTLVRWDEVSELVIEPAPDDNSGSDWVARARGSGNSAYARWSVPSGSPIDVEIRTRFQILNQGQNPVVFLRLRSEAGDSLMSINVGASRTLGLYNDVIKEGLESSYNVSTNDWHDLTVVLFGPEGDRWVAVLLDGMLVLELSGPLDLGGTPIGGIQIGDSTRNRVYDVQYSAFSVTSSPEGAEAGTPASMIPLPAEATPDNEAEGTPVPLTREPVSRFTYVLTGGTKSLALRGPIPP
jgi:hypothetical protein